MVNITIHSIRNISLLKMPIGPFMCKCKNLMCSPTKSAVDKNLSAKASSNNPNTTLTLFNHPPDFGNAVSKVGKNAKSTKGSDRAKENENMPTIRLQYWLLVDAPANKAPRKG